MATYTADQCKAVVEQTGMARLDHHSCGGCGSMVAHVFGKDERGAAQVGFDANCDCGRWTPVRWMTWDDFAHTFNMQSTDAMRDIMWERFKAGKATHE